ncbi:hypothetical protein Tco_1181636, partial [Tanacetum coccineum]
MALYMDEEFYPCFLTTISRRRWILSHGVKLVVMKCLQLPGYLAALRGVIGHVVDKEGPAAETLEASRLQPSLEQLTLLIQRLKDQV